MVITTVVCVTHTKDSLRAELLAARQALLPAARAAANAALCARAAKLAHGLRVAAYSPLGSEPGGQDFVPALADSASQLFLPISRPQGQLHWAEYTDPTGMKPGALGIAEPDGPQHTGALLHGLDLILVPALGVNPAGYRLGKGAGYYDRSLMRVATYTAVVLFDGEVRFDIPTEEHDVAVDALLTPTRWEPFPLSCSLS